MTVKADWTDYNGHLNMAYYNVLFDRCVDEVHDWFGLGPAYVERTGSSTFTAEAHTVYLRELHAADPVYLTCQMLAADEKRTHSFLELFHAKAGFLSATSEQVHLHVDLAAKKVSPFPAKVAAGIEAMRRAHAGLARSALIGRVISLEPKAKERG
jgi:acyl-CoA thioester hydrolase